MQLTTADVDHLAALTGLTSLAYSSSKDEAADPIGAISQLTLLRGLQLGHPSRFTNAQLRRLSTLACLTSLRITGRRRNQLPSFGVHSPWRVLGLFCLSYRCGCGCCRLLGRVCRRQLGGCAGGSTRAAAAAAAVRGQRNFW